MQGKILRFPFEHAAMYAADCGRLATAVLVVVDRGLAENQPSPAQARLRELAARMERVGAELFEIRHELVALRYSPQVAERLSPDDVGALDDLDAAARALDVLTSRAALFVRLHALRDVLPSGLLDTRVRDGILAGVRSVGDLARRGAEAAGDVFLAIAAIEALHDGTTIEQALEREYERWR